MKGNIYEYESGRYMVRFQSICKRFRDKREAERFLTGQRYEVDKGSFDPRDYSKDKPLAFESLVEKYLERKKVKSIGKIKYHLSMAVNYWQDNNVKDISYGELEDFFYSLPDTLSSKSKKNIMDSLHAFFRWFEDVERDRNPFYRMPKFPVVKYELGWRKIVDKDTQGAILEEIKRISYHINPKIYIGCLWLSTYPSIRPIELLHIKEGDFTFDPPMVNIKYNKESKPKVVPMLQEDIEMVRSFPRSLPHLYFFRHVPGISGVKAGERFGDKYLYKWWKRACKNLGIEGVDLYGGTKHSTVTAMSNSLGYGRAKQATMHSTNRAFERYLIADPESIRNAYATARGFDNVLITFPGVSKRS
ncbi:MAG: hypothetical protein JRI26_05630 [Deltaproteobacteria bacterium]|nr:hypothetical protein [Deltaproteobacteria bacterium]